jgi:hypothetical protein
MKYGRPGSVVGIATSYGLDGSVVEMIVWRQMGTTDVESGRNPLNSKLMCV